MYDSDNICEEKDTGLGSGFIYFKDDDGTCTRSCGPNSVEHRGFCRGRNADCSDAVYRGVTTNGKYPIGNWILLNDMEDNNSIDCTSSTDCQAGYFCEGRKCRRDYRSGPTWLEDSLRQTSNQYISCRNDGECHQALTGAHRCENNVCIRKRCHFVPIDDIHDLKRLTAQETLDDYARSLPPGTSVETLTRQYDENFLTLTTPLPDIKIVPGGEVCDEHITRNECESYAKQFNLKFDVVANTVNSNFGSFEMYHNSNGCFVRSIRDNIAPEIFYVTNRRDWNRSNPSNSRYDPDLDPGPNPRKFGRPCPYDAAGGGGDSKTNCVCKNVV